MLIQLEGGNWVDPNDVTGVLVRSRAGIVSVVVLTWPDASISISCDGPEDPEVVRDRIALKINEARGTETPVH